MRVMVFIKGDERSEAGEMPSEQLLTEMLSYNEDLVNAGVMLAGEGLHPSSRGAKVKMSTGGVITVVDGPFAEAKELVVGFWMWQVKSMDEAIEWAKRIPDPDGLGGEVEIREIFEMDDFGPELTPELRQREQQLREQGAELQK